MGTTKDQVKYMTVGDLVQETRRLYEDGCLVRMIMAKPSPIVVVDARWNGYSRSWFYRVLCDAGRIYEIEDAWIVKFNEDGKSRT